MSASIPVWLKCRACGWTWRIAVIEPTPIWQGVTPQSFAGEPCNKCSTTLPMDLIDAPEGETA